MGWDTPARAEARRRTKAGEGFVYVAACRGGLIKIGFSLDPQRRLKTLGFMGEGGLLAAIPGSVLKEKAIHRALLGVRRAVSGLPGECYPRSILSHPGIVALFGCRAIWAKPSQHLLSLGGSIRGDA